MTNPSNPEEALAAIRAAREGVSDRLATKGWRYDLTYSAIASGMVGSQAAPGVWPIAGSIAGAILLTIIFTAESRRTGVRILGTTPKRARWVAIGLGLLLLTGMLTLVYVKRAGAPMPLGWVVAGVMALAFGAAFAGSRLWRRVQRADMQTLS